jgi:hypothetical protein
MSKTASGYSLPALEQPRLELRLGAVEIEVVARPAIGATPTMPYLLAVERAQLLIVNLVSAATMYSARPVYLLLRHFDPANLLEFAGVACL